MLSRKIFRIVFSALAIRRPIDIVLRPALFLFAITIVQLAVKITLTELRGSDLLIDTVLVLLITTPFVCLCFALLYEQDRQQRDLSNEAQTDELTGLPNRRAFFRRSKSALRAGRQGYFLIIDADHFKRINDTLGHPSGDVCLQAIADRIKNILREYDLIGRIGGEEFGVLLFERTIEELQRTAGRLCFPINVSIQGHPEPLRLTVSAGATEIRPGDRIEDVTTRADEALIGAKNNGRERMVLWRHAKKAA